MTISANGKPLLSAEIRETRGGVWSAEIIVDSEEPLHGPVEIEWNDGALVFLGTARKGHGESDNGRVTARVIGGAAGLSQTVAALNYTDVEVRTIVQDILASTGEALDSASTEEVLSVRIPHWTRLEGAGGRALQSLADEVGATWRMLRNGLVWFGLETWPPLKMKFDEILQLTSENGLLIAPEGLPLVKPGVLFEEKQVSEVTTRVDSTLLQQDLRFEGTAQSKRGRQLDAHHALIRSAIGNQLDHSALYPAKVVQQSGDLKTVDIMPDDARIKGQGLTKIPIRYGVPGVMTKLVKGARVLLGFEAADPKRPYVAVFEAHSIEEYTLTTDKNITLVTGTKVQIDCTDVVVNASGKTQVNCPDVQLGNGSLDAVALSTKVMNELNAIKLAYDTHVHPTAVGPSSPPVPMTPPGSVAASNTRAS